MEIQYTLLRNTQGQKWELHGANGRIVSRLAELPENASRLTRVETIASLLTRMGAKVKGNGMQPGTENVVVYAEPPQVSAIRFKRKHDADFDTEATFALALEWFINQLQGHGYAAKADGRHVTIGGRSYRLKGKVGDRQRMVYRLIVTA